MIALMPRAIAILLSMLPHTPKDPGEVDALIAALYADMGCTSRKDLRARKADTASSLILRACERVKASGERPLRYFPADFLVDDPSDPYAVPFPSGAQWRTLASLAELVALGSGAMIVAPLYIQAEPIAWDALHPLGIPVSIMHGGNIPVVLEILRQTGFRMVVTDDTSLPALSDQLDSVENAVATILMFAPLMRMRSLGREPLPRPMLFREFHLSPGCPVFFQSPVEAGTDLFRVNPDFLVEAGSDTVTITALCAQALPALNYEVPLRMREIKSGLFEILP